MFFFFVCVCWNTIFRINVLPAFLLGWEGRNICIFKSDQLTLINFGARLCLCLDGIISNTRISVPACDSPSTLLSSCSSGVDLRSNRASLWSNGVSVTLLCLSLSFLFYWQFGCVENILRGINGGHKLWYGYLNTLNSNWPCSDKDACSPLRPSPWTEFENRNYWFLPVFNAIASTAFYLCWTVLLSRT